MPIPKSPETCRYCNKSIIRKRTPEGFPRFMWATVKGGNFYCPKAGGDCRHEMQQEKEGKQ